MALEIAVRGLVQMDSNLILAVRMVNAWLLLQSDDPVSASRDGTDRALIQGRFGKA